MEGRSIAGFASKFYGEYIVMHSTSLRHYPSHDAVVTLGSSNAPISHKPLKPPSEGNGWDGSTKRSQRGLKGISSEAKRRLRSALVIMENIYRKENLSFLTCTIPPLDTDHWYQLVGNWGEIERKFIQKLKRAVSKKGIDFQHVSVTEIQEKRSLKYGVIAPHLHIVFPGRRDRYSSWVLTVKEITHLWQSILENELGFPIDCKAATNIQQVKVSVKRYLSKYMSKGGEILETLISAGLREWIPRNWYSCSRDLCKAVEASIKKVKGAIAEYVYDKREYLKSIGLITWFHVVTLEIPDYQTDFIHVRTVGMVFGFNDNIPIADILSQIYDLMAG